MTDDLHFDQPSRQDRAEAAYARLFGPRDTSVADTDPEFMEILRRFIFADVFSTGDLNDQTRELVTITVLTCMQTLPQLRSHADAALTVGVSPVALRETVYQLAPFIGFPRTLNALGVINEVFAEHGIELPLPDQGRVNDDTRYEEGLAIQAPLYGTEIADNLADLPAPFAQALPQFLTEFGFGDFATRTGLTSAQRELFILCALVALGDTGPQLTPHARAAIQLGNSTETVLAALVQCFGYIGFPRMIAGVRAVKNL